MSQNVLDIKFVLADDDIERIRLHRDILRSLFPENKIYEFLNGFEAISFMEAKSMGTDWDAGNWCVLSDFYMPIKNGGDMTKFCFSKGIEKFCIISSASSENLRVKLEKEFDVTKKVRIYSKNSDLNDLKDWLRETILT